MQNRESTHSMEFDKLQIEKNILRKLRKKLRQIENLEQLGRPLNPEELIKVTKKEEIRNELLNLTEDIEKLGTNTVETTVKTEENAENVENVKADKMVDVVDEVSTTNCDSEIILPSKRDSEIISERKKMKFSCDWKNEVFSVKTLKGHSDVITCVVTDENFIVSSSRDTTVKVWDSVTGNEIQSLRGHTASVTCLILLQEVEGNKLLWSLGYDRKGRVAMSGSIDCMVKTWILSEGMEIKSFYTYNEITCIGYLSTHQFIVTGTEGGKLELWNSINAQNLSSVSSFGDSFTNIKILDKRVFASSSEGFISVWELQEEELLLLFSSEKLLLNETPPAVPRKIRSIELINGLIYYGDDGINVKMLNWENGDVNKFPNHLRQFGATDAICTSGKEVLCSSYNLDYGYGSINVRHLPGNEYLTSLGDGQTGRILSMSATKTENGKLRFVTGGIELKNWEAIGIKKPKQEIPNVDHVRTTSIVAYGGQVVNSEMESSDSGSELDVSDEDWEPSSTTYIPKEVTYRSSSIFSWCSIL
uniref:Uncharacterized protein n=1 Tax=Strigamia maritima TaxID=126957 RepID=T1IJC2_STRMM